MHYAFELRIQNHCVTWLCQWFRPETHALLKICIITLCIIPAAVKDTNHFQQGGVMNTLWWTPPEGVAWVFMSLMALMRFHSSYGSVHHWIPLIIWIGFYWNTLCYNACVYRRPRQQRVCDYRQKCPIKNSFFWRQEFLYRYVYFSTLY